MVSKFLFLHQSIVPVCSSVFCSHNFIVEFDVMTNYKARFLQGLLEFVQNKLHINAHFCCTLGTYSMNFLGVEWYRITIGFYDVILNLNELAHVIMKLPGQLNDPGKDSNSVTGAFQFSIFPVVSVSKMRYIVRNYWEL